MGKRCKITAAVLIVSFIMLTFAVPGFAAQTSDIKGHWAESIFVKWADKGWVSGYPDGGFKPGKIVSRAEFARMMNNCFGLTEISKTVFPDVSPKDWFFTEIGKAVANGYFGGFPDGCMRPNNDMRRLEAFAAIARFLKLDVSGGTDMLDRFRDFKEIPKWCRPNINALIANGIIFGNPDGTIRPTAPVSRAETIALLERALEILTKLKEKIPAITAISASNGTIGVSFDKDAAGISSGDFSVTAMLDSSGYTFENLSFDSRKRNFTFTPIARTSMVQTLEITVSASPGTGKIRGSAKATLTIPAHVTSSGDGGNGGGGSGGGDGGGGGGGGGNGGDEKPPSKSSDATLKDLKVDNVTIAGFNPGITRYSAELPEGTKDVPSVTAVVNDTGRAKAAVTDAEGLPGTSTVVVTAEDGSKMTYTVDFTLAEAAPEVTLESIEITVPAVRLKYAVGDMLDISGMVVTGTYSDKSTKVLTVTVADISGFNGSAPAESQVLTITIDGKSATYTISVEAALEDVAVTSAASIDDKTVAYGSPAALPETVEVTLNNGDTATADISWDEGAPKYDAKAAGDYIFTGTLYLAGVTIPDELRTATVKVTVTQAAVTAVSAIDNVIVDHSTSLDTLKTKLPEKVNVTLNNADTAEADITWDYDSAAYNPAVAGDYIFTGTLYLAGVTIPDELKTATVKVTVSPPAILAITGVPEYDGMAVAQGTDIASVVLPQNVTVTLEDNSTLDVGVTWDVGTPQYDKDVLGIYTFAGTLTLPDGVANPDNKAVSIMVEVVIPNCDPNLDTALCTSAGITLFEFDSLADWKSTTSAAVSVDRCNFVSGSASSMIAVGTPTPIAGTDPEMDYISLQTSGTIGDMLVDMQNMEFNLYIPDKTEFDFLLFNFYTDVTHNYFYQCSIGNWELTQGWNKIRRSVSDFTYIDSIGLTGATDAVGMSLQLSMAASLDSPVQENRKIEMQSQIQQFNKALALRKSSGLPKNRGLKSFAPAKTTAPGWGSIDCMEALVSFKSTSTPVINLDRIAFNVTGAAKLLFTFDDAWYDVLTNAAPILSDAGFKATLWANKEDSVAANEIPIRGGMDIMNESDLASMYAAGWDIGNHTVSHIDTIDSMADDVLTAEYLDNQVWLNTKGWTRAACHACYPSGSYSERLINILKSIGVLSGRTTVYGIQPTPVYNIYKLKCVWIGRDSDVDAVAREIDRAVETGSTIIFMLHRVEAEPVYDDSSEYNALAVSTDKLSQIVDYVKALTAEGKIEVQTVSEWYYAYMQSK